MPPNQLFATAHRVLGDHGANLREAEGVLTFVADREIGSRDIPLLISGRAPAEVPPTHRTGFQLVPMRVGRTNVVAGFLNQRSAAARSSASAQTSRAAPMEMLERAAEMFDVLEPRP